MKLFYSPGACSLAPHIVALELGLNLETVKVDLQTKRTRDGDFLAINPKGYVPALELENGEVITESGVVMQYLADQMPVKGLIPKAGSMARYRLQEWLNYLTAEIHKTYTPLFDPSAADQTKDQAKQYLKKRYTYLNEKLAGSKFLMGDQFTVADAYLYTVTRWASFLKVDLTEFGNILGFMERMQNRPAVQAALKAEGLKQ